MIGFGSGDVLLLPWWEPPPPGASEVRPLTPATVSHLDDGVVRAWLRAARYPSGLPTWLQARDGQRLLEDAIRSGEARLYVGLDGAHTALGATAPVVDPRSPREQPTTPTRPTEVRPDTWFEVELVDELGEALSGVEVSFRVAGRVAPSTTDGAGVARAPAPGGTARAVVSVTYDAALIAALRERWDRPRGVPRQGWDRADVELPFWSRRGSPAHALQNELRLRVSLQPGVPIARLAGLNFDKNKCFLLPPGLPALSRITELYRELDVCDLLIVGHTDKSGQAAYNAQLALERAESLRAYLTDDVDAWVRWYAASVPDEKRWGAPEDRRMMAALADRGLTSTGVADYQRWHDALEGADRAPSWAPLEVDGRIGPLTRAQLVGDYMHRDGTTLPEGVHVVTHGAGEHFPLEGADASNASAEDRRVELFFFDAALGVQPPVATGSVSQAGSEEYPEWLRRKTDRLHATAEPDDYVYPNVVAGLEDFPRGDSLWDDVAEPELVPVALTPVARKPSGYRLKDPPGVLQKSKFYCWASALESYLNVDPDRTYLTQFQLVARYGEKGDPKTYGHLELGSANYERMLSDLRLMASRAKRCDRVDLMGEIDMPLRKLGYLALIYTNGGDPPTSHVVLVSGWTEIPSYGPCLHVMDPGIGGMKIMRMSDFRSHGMCLFLAGRPPFGSR